MNVHIGELLNDALKIICLNWQIKGYFWYADSERVGVNFALIRDFQNHHAHEKFNLEKINL